MVLHGRRVDQSDNNQIETLLENTQCYTTREIADILKMSKSSTENHFQLGYVHRFDIWVLHKLSEKNLLDRISAGDSLLKCNKNIPFFKKKL